MVVVNRVHDLTFGSLTWIQDGANPPDANGVQYRVQAQDASLGTAIPITQALLWLGRAGGPVSWDHTDNREPVFRVRVMAADSNLLALGERALQLECEQPSTLSWTPPDGNGDPSVFDIVWSHLEPVYDADGLTGLGMEESVTNARTYMVRMQALPYARAASTVVTAAVPTATETVVDDGTSATGWTAATGTVASTAGAIVNSFTEPVTDVRLLRTGTISVTGKLYIAVTWKATDPVVYSIRLLKNASMPNTDEAMRTDAGSGFTTSWFQLPTGATSVPSVNIAALRKGTASGAYTFSIDKVSTWTSLPFIGTARQKPMSITAGGSVDTYGNIQVASATSSLGKVLVYTGLSNTGYMPPLRRWRLSSDAVTSDATRVSGAFNALTGNMTFNIPISAQPQGLTEIWAILGTSSGTGNATIQWGASTVMGTTVVGGLLTGQTIINFTTVGAWAPYLIGRFASPTAQAGPAAVVQIGLQKISGTPVVQIDEAYLFDVEHGSLTVVDCGSGATSVGGPSPRLFIDAPTPAVPMGAVYRGNAADRSDQWHAGSLAQSWGVHMFDPLGTNILVVTDNATDATTSLEHYRRYNTFVARGV